MSSRVVIYEVWKSHRRTFFYRITRRFSWDVHRTLALLIRNARGNKVAYLYKLFSSSVIVIRDLKLQKFAPVCESRDTQVLISFFMKRSRTDVKRTDKRLIRHLVA